jgi:hypothetical protein
VNGQDSQAEIFDVFLCHNSEDKPAVREIAQQLVKEGIKPWLGEDEIRPGISWQTAIAEQIKSIRSAAVFVGENGLGLWQNEEIQVKVFSANLWSGNLPSFRWSCPTEKRHQSSPGPC